jgi:hypothetical protein
MANNFLDSYSGVQYAQTGATYFDNVMTNWFLQNFPDAKNNGCVLLPMIDAQPAEAVGGKAIVFPVSFGRNTGTQNIGMPGSASGTTNPKIPVPGRQSFGTMATRTRQGMATISMDGPVLRNAKLNGGAYADALTLEMSKVMDDQKIDRARQVHNDGSGRLAEVGAVSTTTVTLKVNTSIEGATNTRGVGTLDQTGWLDVNQRIAFITNDGTPTVRTVNGSTASGCYILTISSSGNNVTITCALTPGGSAIDFTTPNPDLITVGDWIVRAADEDLNSYVDTNWRADLTGIGGIMSDANVFDGVGLTSASQQLADRFVDTTANSFQGVAVSGNTWNQAVVLDNGAAGNRPISGELMQQALSDAEKRNNAQVQFILSSFETYNSYVALATPDKRYDNTTNLNTGHTSLSFNGVPWFKDRFCYQNRVYFLDLSPLRRLETAPMSALTNGDGMQAWERVMDTSGGPLDKYWRGWVWQDQLAVCEGVRERMGAVLTELSA